MWSCYLLHTADDGDKRTYVGMTNDLDHRLRQHNGALAGGAAATHGRRWVRICSVGPFPDKRAALQFEWRWKQLSRPPKAVGDPLTRRMRGLQLLMAMDRPTSAAIAYADYPVPLEVRMEEGTEIPLL